MLLRALVALLLLVLSLQAQTPLANQVKTLLADPKVSRAHWGIEVTTLEGTPLYTLNEAQYFRPASNTKLYTTAAALAILGPDATVTTKVVAHDLPIDGTLHGDLFLKGAGDANLSGRQLPYLSPRDRPKPAPTPALPFQYLDELAAQLAAMGLKTITGDIVGDDTLFPYEPYPADWSIDDTVWGYGAPVSALTITDNQLTLTITPGKVPGQSPAVTLDPAQPPYYSLDTSALTTGSARSGSHIQIERPLASRTLRLYGSIATDAPPEVEEIAIHDPPEYAAIAFKQILVTHGIAVEGKARAEHRLNQDPASFVSVMAQPLQSCGHSAVTGTSAILAEHRSAPLVQDVAVTNKVSQNLHAELLLHRLGAMCNSSTSDGTAAIRLFLTQQAHLDPDDFVFYDGSGLSGHDLTTPRATAKLLVFAATQPWFTVFKQSLPIGGEDGSLIARFPNLPLKDHVFAKTGTLGESRALSGYLTAASGKTFIFSIMVDNHTPRTTADRDTMDRIVAAIAAAN